MERDWFSIVMKGLLIGFLLLIVFIVILVFFSGAGAPNMNTKMGNM